MKLLTPWKQMFLDDGVKIGLEKGLREGRQEGRQEGLEQGRAQGAVVLLERQLTQRFGPLPQAVRKKLEKASLAQVEAWSDALAWAQSLRQVFSSSQ